MEADEALGPKASISAVLYANLTHPEWKTEFPCTLKIYFINIICYIVYLNFNCL